jgi:hypothetical protein
MSNNNFSVKSHKFQASNVIISDIKETANGKPTLRLKYRYPDTIGLLNIQMDEKIVKMGVTGMAGETPAPVSTGTSDSLSLSFTDNELFGKKEKHFIQEVEKLETMIKEKLAPKASELFDSISDKFDKNMIATVIDGLCNSSIKYSTKKDAKGKKTKEHDHKYTSLRLKMYKNTDEETGALYYQGIFIPHGQTEPVRMDLNNTEDVIPKWSKIKSIVSLRSVWIVPKTGFGITWTPNRVLVTELSEGFTQNDFEPDSDDEEDNLAQITKQASKIDFTETLEEPESEDDIDDLITTVPKVVEPKPKSRKTAAK